jgi:ATP-binding cassette subfamily C (CFTR/MRP) protein 4
METDNYMTSTQRLFEYAELSSEGVHELNPDFQITHGKIEVQNLFMKYRENYDYALKNLNFTIQAGTKTGIIGRTGAGKSSIMQVLFRLTNPEQGTILIDGQDYLTAGLHDLRKQMSVIPQSATLFIASLRDNLDPFHEHSDENILKVLKKVRLASLLELLPKGLDSEINSAGLSLSAGQKQLVCLARAVLRKNKIIMIDEATANVDSETDEFIQKQLNRRFKGSTLLIIAHRLRTIIESDWIVVMDAGATTEEGIPREMVRKKGSALMAMINHTGPEESAYLMSKLATKN